MAKKDPRSPEQKIRQLELELADKDRELIAFRRELSTINQQLEKFIKQLADELKLAGLIQRSLVPTDIPTIPGFEFSTKFISSSLKGGDYFDIFELEDKMKFGILLANSSGHGMASLFLSVLLKLTTLIEARKGLEPSDVLNHMAKEIKSNLQGEDFANVFYCVIDRRHFKLNYSKSGAVLSFLYKYSDDKLIKLDATQSAIGKNSEEVFSAEELLLDPRDKLILMSEGIVKSLNSGGEEFGEDRLYHCMLETIHGTCHEVRNEILFQVSQFVGAKEYPQDLSVLIVEVKDKVIKLSQRLT